MSAFFTKFFSDYLSANPSAMTGAVLKLVLFREAPAFESNDASYLGITTMADLLAKPGWLEAQSTGYPLGNTLTVGVQNKGVNHYVMFNQFPFSGMGQAEAVAVGIQMSGTFSGKVDPIIFVSNTPFDTRKVVSDGDGLTAFNDSNLAGASKKWLFSWADPPASTTQIVSMVEGPLALFLGAPSFEPSHSQHVWLYPQRANMAANPSFEAPGMNFWASNGAKTREAITTPLLGVGAYEGKFAGGGPYSAGYLTPTIGTVTTPDPGPLPAQCTFVFHTKGPTTNNTTLAAQWYAVQAWQLFRHVDNGNVIGIFQDATDTNAVRTPNGLPVPTEDDVFAVSLDTAAGTLAGRHYDGTTWTTTATATGAPFTVRPSPDTVQIGAYNDGIQTQPFTGRIYSVELRTGLDPAGGTVLWRFDADDYPGTGTSYVDPRGRTWTLSNASAITPKVLPLAVESNVFPTQYQEQWTVQFRAKGTGKIKVGFVYWEDNFLETATDWGEETWTLSPDSYIHISTCRVAPQAYQGMLRIECDGGTVSLDQVLVEAGFLKDWPYFDGDSTYGARDDFSWYGGATRRGGSYSLWYNNKRVLYGHMFSRDIEDGTLITDEVMREQGYVYNWVPAGTFVVPHMDVFYPFDIQSPVPAKGAAVIPYRVDPDTDLLGVLNPWV